MLNVDKFAIAMLFIGAGLGTLAPKLTSPLDFINPYISFLFLIIGVVFLILK
jgi:hypothetical protein